MAKGILVSEKNLQAAAVKILPKHNKLVSAEVNYLLRELGDRVPRSEMEEAVRKVRTLPWRTIVGE